MIMIMIMIIVIVIVIIIVIVASFDSVPMVGLHFSNSLRCCEACLLIDEKICSDPFCRI